MRLRSILAAAAILLASTTSLVSANASQGPKIIEECEAMCTYMLDFEAGTPQGKCMQVCTNCGVAQGKGVDAMMPKCICQLLEGDGNLPVGPDGSLVTLGECINDVEGTYALFCTQEQPGSELCWAYHNGGLRQRGLRGSKTHEASTQ